MRLAAFLLLVLVLTPACLATDYYVSPGGSDSANGTSSPWQTLAKVGGAALQPGDRVFLQGGQTFAGPLTANWSGSAGSPIIIDSYRSGRATIQITSATQAAIGIYNRHHLEFDNLILSGSQMASSSKAGFDAYADAAADQPHLVARNLAVSGFKTGIQIGAWNGGWGFTDVLIENCESHDNRTAGIFTYGQTLSSHERVTIRGCLAYNNRGDSAATSNTGNGILVNGVTSGLIEHCIAHDNGDLGFGSVAIWTYGVSGVTIQYCEAYHQRSSSTSDGGGFDFDGGTANSLMQYNYSHDCDGAGFLFAQYSGAQSGYGSLSGNIVRYNKRRPAPQLRRPDVLGRQRHRYGGQQPDLQQYGLHGRDRDRWHADLRELPGQQLLRPAPAQQPVHRREQRDDAGECRRPPRIVRPPARQPVLRQQRRGLPSDLGRLLRQPVGVPRHRPGDEWRHRPRVQRRPPPDLASDRGHGRSDLGGRSQPAGLVLRVHAVPAPVRITRDRCRPGPDLERVGQPERGHEGFREHYDPAGCRL